MKVLAKFLFAFFFAALATNASAQASFGLRGGVNLSTWTINGEAEEELGDFQKNRTSLLFGVISEIRFSDNLAIQPEINFIQKGTRFEESETDPVLGNASFKLDYILNYIEVPVLLKGGAGFGAGRIDVLAGPSFGYALNGKQKSEITFLGMTEKETEDIDFKEDEVSRTDFGLQFGAALSLNLGSSAKLFVDGRYLLGLTNLNTSENTSSDDWTPRNRGIALTAGVLIAF